MTDQDPPIEPLRRLDPSEPDEQGLGRLERLDPEAEDANPAAAAAAAGAAPPKAASRLRDGLTAAVTLAALLSLSSIAAIGGLVAVSMRSAPHGGIEAVAPMDAGSPLTTIRVGESAQGAPEQPDRDRSDPPPQDDDSVVEFTPVDPPSPVNGGAGTGGGNGGGDGNQGGAGSGGGDKGAGGAWCDAREGGACDATRPGSVLGPATEPEGDGYVGGEDDEVEDDDQEDDDQGSSSGSSSSSGSGHPGKGH